MRTKGYKTALFLSVILVISAIAVIAIADDTEAPIIEFIPPTPENATEVPDDVVVNESISDDDISLVWLDWDGTNYIMYAAALNIYNYTVTNLTNGTTYTYKVYANDTSDNIGVSETRSVTIITDGKKSFDLELGEGWNLISIPLAIDNASINAVFPDAKDGDELYNYDGDDWQIATYYSALPGWHGDFETVEPDKGYWYSANATYTATIEGTEVGTRDVSIAEGWNLIGYTRLSAANLDDLLTNVTDKDELYDYDGDDWQIATYYSDLPGWHGDMSTMEPGKGYWYNANTSFTWEY